MHLEAEFLELDFESRLYRTRLQAQVKTISWGGGGKKGNPSLP